MINSRRKEEGITLIALVITIIVLLILAGIAIGMVSGDNGILNRAINAKEKIEDAAEIEKNIIKNMGNNIGPKVEISIEKSEDYLFAIKSTIKITDVGLGIDMDRCKYIFTNDSNNIENIETYTEGNIPVSGIIEKAKGPGTWYLHVLAVDNIGNKTVATSNNAVTIESVENFDYAVDNEGKGRVQTTHLMPGVYQLEVWGAEGGSVDSNVTGGYGGYATGCINLDKNTDLFICIGGAGSKTTYAGETVSGGYNGGGDARQNDTSSKSNCSGGGATHIADLNKGELSEYAEFVENILIVAGGGGGANYPYYASNNYYYSSGGHGGGQKGGSTRNGASGHPTLIGIHLQGGGQEVDAAPYGGQSNVPEKATAGEFGKGAWYHTGGGPGGGYYGGNAGHNWAGSGGSGYIANPKLISINNITKHMAGYEVDSSTTPEIYTDGVNLVSENAESNKAKQGNGYAKIININ